MDTHVDARPVTSRDLLVGSVWQGFWRWPLLAFTLLGDAVNFKIALGELAAEEDAFSIWTLVVALSLAAVGLMHFAGQSAAAARTRSPSWRYAGASVLVMVWLALGGCAFYLRLHRPAAENPFATDPVATTGVDATNMPLSILLLCLYIATGALTAWAAYNHGPSRIAMLSARWPGRLQRWAEQRARRRERITERRAARRARREQRRIAIKQRFAAAWAVVADVLAAIDGWIRRRYQAAARRYTLRRPRAERRAIRRHTTAEAAVVAAQHEVEIAKEDLASESDRLVASHAYCREWARELKQLSRLALAIHLADPASTSALTSTSLPEADTPLKFSR